LCPNEHNQRGQTAGHQDPADLDQGLLVLGDVLQHVCRDHSIHRLVTNWQVTHVGQQQGGLRSFQVRFA